MKEGFEDKVVVVVAAVAALALLAIALYGINDCRNRHACEDKGGVVEKYDCHDDTVCTTTRIGSQSITHCTTEPSCSWRCVLPTERP